MVRKAGRVRFLLVFAVPHGPLSLFGHASTRRGEYDRGEKIVLPEGKTLLSKQLDEVAAVVRERQAEVVILLEEETAK